MGGHIANPVYAMEPRGLFDWQLPHEGLPLYAVTASRLFAPTQPQSAPRDTQHLD